LLTHDDLPSFIAGLERAGELKRVTVPVDPALEITEIAVRTVKEGGPALLFEKVKGSPYPVAINLFGTPRRVALALGRSPEEIGEEMARAAEDFTPPKLSALWKHRGLLWRAARMAPSRCRRGPVNEVCETPNLDEFPILTCWPQDGGRFFTLPLVITQNPSGHRNMGMYRLHTYDKATTGMHIQIERGGGAHLAEWEALHQPMPTAVALGGDPATILCSILPLPENMDELAFAGFLRGKPLPLVRLSNGVDVPANAEFVLEGVVPPHERRLEGPFGDHFGHYSRAALHPVFHISKVHRRSFPIYPATVVGRPPQEDKHMGNAVQEMLLPLLKIMRPELLDLWAYQEAGFHNLAVVSVKQRYAKEGVKTALGLMGQGQMSLTKCVVLVDPGVNVRSFDQTLDQIRQHFNPEEDFIVIPGTAQDTLDFTSFKMNLGSKMIIDATSFGKKNDAPSPSFRSLTVQGPQGQRWPCRNWGDALLVVQSDGSVPGRDILAFLLKEISGFKFIAVVSDDVPLADDELLLWGLFTRFDCARDVTPAESALHGVWATFKGTLGIDATWKPGYPDPLQMNPDVVQQVTRRWGDFS